MKNYKKTISVLAAVSMLLTSAVSVSAKTRVGGTTYRSPFDSIASGTSLTHNTYYPVHVSGAEVDGTTDPCYVAYTPDGGFVQPRDDFYCSGTRALYIAARNSSGGARFDMHFNVGAESSEYHLSFNRRSNSTDDWRNFVTVNTYEWNGGNGGDHVKLSNTSFWTVTEITGADGYTWKHYEATITQNATPKRVMFKAFGWGEHIIDDVCVKDKHGNILFSEDFDYFVLTEGEDHLATYTDGWEKGGNLAYHLFEVRKEESNNNHRLLVYGTGETGKDNVGTYRIALPKKSANGEYHITYDIELKEGKTDTTASLDMTGSSIYGAGRLTDAGECNVEGTGDYLYFAVEGYGLAYVDNIVVMDGDDNVLFTEDFEDFDEKYTYYAYDTKLQSLSANAVIDEYNDSVIYLSWRNPDRSDIESIQIYENGVETESGQSAYIYTGANCVNRVAMSDNFIGAGTVHNYDVRMITESGELFHNYISAKERTRFPENDKTKDGKPLQGWNINYKDGNYYEATGEYVRGLGSVSYDTLNKAVGNASLHINPNIAVYQEEQTSFRAGHRIDENTYFNGGADLYLDALVYGIEVGKTYKLTFKQKGHFAPSYFVYYIGSGSANNIGRLTTQSGYTNNAAWQDREIEFTPDSEYGVPESGASRLRFDFSDGANDFWLDDVKLVEVGGDGTNLIANGSFEYGLSNLTNNDGTATWTLADSSDIVNVYKKAGDSLIKVASLSAGATSYKIPAFEGTKETLVFKTVKKAGDREFESEEYSLDIKQNSYIYDAKFEVVDENLQAIGTPSNLAGDILLKSSIKIENAGNSLVGTDLYTLIYKNGILLNADKQTVSTGTGEINYSSVVSVPNISDGEYTAKVFVWEMGDLIPLKQAKTLVE